jgi:hypothetical protein
MMTDRPSTPSAPHAPKLCSAKATFIEQNTPLLIPFQREGVGIACTQEATSSRVDRCRVYSACGSPDRAGFIFSLVATPSSMNAPPESSVWWRGRVRLRAFRMLGLRHASNEQNEWRQVFCSTRKGDTHGIHWGLSRQRSNGGGSFTPALHNGLGPGERGEVQMTDFGAGHHSGCSPCSPILGLLPVHQGSTRLSGVSASARVNDAPVVPGASPDEHA